MTKRKTSKSAARGELAMPSDAEQVVSNTAVGSSLLQELMTPPDTKPNPPTVTRLQELDFGGLTWVNFEKLCCRLASLEADVEHCQRYGTAGQGQQGIDIYARMRTDGSFTVYQCKRENNFTASKIRAAVAEFCRGKWATKAKTLVLCTEESLEVTERAEEVEKQRDLLRKKNISFVIWGKTQLSEKLKAWPELVDDFFGRAWVRAFFDEQVVAGLGAEFSQVVLDDYLRAVKRFAAKSPYLALNAMISGEELSLSKSYVPLSFCVSDVAAPPTLLAGEQAQADARDTAKNLVSTLPDILRDARNKNQPVLLRGVGGAGKSTVLHHIGHDVWDNPTVLGLPKGYLPLFVRLPVLASIGEISLTKLLFQSLRAGRELMLEHDLPENFFDLWSRNTNASWLVMFDGLDEVAAERRLETLGRLNDLISLLNEKSHLVLITSRPASGDEEFRQLSEKAIVGELLPFDEAQQKDFASHWFTTRADDFLEKVRRLDASRNWSREPFSLTPLLLTMAAAVYRTNGDLPEAGQNELYRQFINILFKKAEQQGLKTELGLEVFEVARGALEELALAMTDHPEATTCAQLEQVCANFLRDTLAYKVARAQTVAQNLCEVLTRRSGVLFRQGESCQWFHATIREYLAAVALDRKVEDGGDYETIVGRRVGKPKDTELLLIFGNLHYNKRALIRWLTEKAQKEKSAQASVLAYDIWAECGPTTRDELHLEIIRALAYGFGEVNAGSHLEAAAKRLLVEMGERAVETLLEVLAEMNGVQQKLLPEWSDQHKRPDVYTAPGQQIYQAYCIRKEIIEVLGEIGDARAIKPLISLLPQQAAFDSYRYDLARTTHSALLCLGAPALAPLLALIKEAKNPTLKRCAYLAGLVSIGIRTAEVSATIYQCLEEGLRGNKQLLSSSIWAALSLCDSAPAPLIKQALVSDDLDILRRAANYFALMPDESAVSELKSAFQQCFSRSNEEPFPVGWAIKALTTALLATGQPQEQDLVSDFLADNLPGNDKITAYDVVNMLGDSNLKNAPEILLRELVRKLQSKVPDRIIDYLLSEVSSLWQPAATEGLATVAAEALSETAGLAKNFVTRLIQGLNEPPSPKSNQISLSSLISHEKVLKTFAKCRLPNFGAAVSQMLPTTHWSSTMATCDALWLAGDAAAEVALIEKLHQLTTTRKAKEKGKENELPGADEYHVIRALGTCAVSQRGVETVLAYVQEDPRLSIYLSGEVICPLIRRGAVTSEKIAEIALDYSGTLPYARNFCLQTLGAFNAPLFTRVFLDALRHEPHEETRGYVAHALGWAGEANHAEAITTLEDELARTESIHIATYAGKSLVRLKSAASLPLLEAAISRFGSEKMSSLLAATATFRAPSTFEMLPERSNGKGLYSDQTQHMAAYGFYYGQEERAQAYVQAAFEASLEGYDSGNQGQAVNVLAIHDPAWLLKRADQMFDANTLEASAKHALVSCAPQISQHQSCTDRSLVRLYARLLCDQDLAVREFAAASLEQISEPIRREIYALLYACKHDWAHGCAVYALGFWDSDEAEIERARFAVSKTVRFLAAVAQPIRAKRAALKETMHTFAESSGGSSRVAAYYALAEQAEPSHIKMLARKMDYHHPAVPFLRVLRSEVKKRVANERRERAKAEKASLCQRAQTFAVPFS